MKSWRAAVLLAAIVLLGAGATQSKAKLPLRR